MVFPELVEATLEGYKRVEYGRPIAPVIETVKERHPRRQALEVRLASSRTARPGSEQGSRSAAPRVRRSAVPVPLSA